jgi:cell division protein FtsB
MKKLIIILGSVAAICVGALAFLFWNKENGDEVEEKRLRTEPARKARLDYLAREKQELKDLETSLNNQTESK